MLNELLESDDLWRAENIGAHMIQRFATLILLSEKKASEAREFETRPFSQHSS